VTYKNTNFRSYSRRAFIDLPKLCMLIELVEAFKKVAYGFSIQRVVFPGGAKMLVFDN